MANKDHLEILEKGQAEWNIWRKEKPDTWPDLSNTDLSGKDLRYYDFVYASFQGSNLDKSDFEGSSLFSARCEGASFKGANLSICNLEWSLFIGCDLSEANILNSLASKSNFQQSILKKANLAGSNFSRSIFWFVDLTEAYLSNTNFLSTAFRNANFTSAQLGQTVFVDADFTAADGLDMCQHGSISYLDHRAYENSGYLPPIFMKGCGLPETLVDYLPTIFTTPIQRQTCFISYSAQDSIFAQKLYEDLRKNDVRCWFAPESLRIGDKIWDSIDSAISLHDRLLLVLSNAAIDSEWVEDEVTRAFAEERERGEVVLMPIRIDDSVMSTNEAWASKLRNSRNIGDFRNWHTEGLYEKSLGNLLNDLHA